MDFDRYLELLGQLYVDAASSKIHPRLLRRLGGALALAGRDADWIRVEEDAALGFIDMQRDPADVQRLARERWRAHEAAIHRRIQSGIRPADAVRAHLAAYGTVPHNPVAVEQMTALTTGQASTYPAWRYDLAEWRRRFQRGGDVGTSFLGALTTMTYLVATAEDWEHATPREWDQTLDIGEIGVAAEGVLGSPPGRAPCVKLIGLALRPSTCRGAPTSTYGPPAKPHVP